MRRLCQKHAFRLFPDRERPFKFLLYARAFFRAYCSNVAKQVINPGAARQAILSLILVQAKKSAVGRRLRWRLQRVMPSCHVQSTLGRPAVNKHRKAGYHRGASLGYRGQLRDRKKRTRPRSQRDPLLARLAPPCLARHAGLRHDGRDPASRQHRRCSANGTRDPCGPPLIRWSIQEIRSIAKRLAQRRIERARISRRSKKCNCNVKASWPILFRGHQPRACSSRRRRCDRQPL
jgi:hypothetical protein